jgi:hypothetical protein
MECRLPVAVDAVHIYPCRKLIVDHVNLAVHGRIKEDCFLRVGVGNKHNRRMDVQTRQK